LIGAAGCPDASTDTSATVADLLKLRVNCPETHIIVGAMIMVRPNDDSYRNSVLLWDANGDKYYRDKQVPAPGGEQVPFGEVPWLGSLFSQAGRVEGVMITEPIDRHPVPLGSIRVATAVCFEHTLLDTHIAWGADRGEADLLVTVADLSRLDDDAATEVATSRAARRLHVARLNAPLIYVSNIGVECIATDGNSSVSGYRNGMVSCLIELQRSVYPLWPVVQLTTGIGVVVAVFIREGTRHARASTSGLGGELC
jgi:hypothetical protein